MNVYIKANKVICDKQISVIVFILPLIHMAKLALDMSAMQEDFFAEAAMIGIVTALPGYHLCWVLNKHFDIDFVREPEQDIPLQKKGNRYNYPIYQYNLPNSAYKYLLYKLKDGKEPLLPETKELDYLWLIQTANPGYDAENIASELKNIADIQLAQILAPEQLKSLSNLLV